MKSKEQFQRNQEMSIEDAIENFRELVTASDAPERKYLVVITVNKIGYNFNVDASNHEEALQCALQNYKVSPYPQVGTADCIVYGICKDQQLRLRVFGTHGFQVRDSLEKTRFL